MWQINLYLNTPANSDSEDNHFLQFQNCKECKVTYFGQVGVEVVKVERWGEESEMEEGYVYAILTR